MKISSFYDICDRYDAFIFDLWGVIHNGADPLPGAIDTLKFLQSNDKEVCFLSNAPRRKELIIDRLNQMGIGPDLYDFVMSSGEDAYLHLKSEIKEHLTKIYHLDHGYDIGFYEGLDHYELVDHIGHADVIVNSASADADYEDLLREGIRRHIPMMCINPDKVVMYHGREVGCPGITAEYYEEMGGEVWYHGKPYPKIYERCFVLLQCKDRSKILALGDGLHTDIQGANRQGIDSALLATGIHGKDFGLDWGSLKVDEEKANASLSRSKHKPTYLFSTLRHK